MDATRTAIRKLLLEADVCEKLELKDFNEYARLVAEAYEEAPSYDPDAARYWEALNSSNQILFRRFLGRSRVEYTDEDPYESSEEMQRDFRETGVLKIYSGDSEHPIFSVEDNLLFRTVHDYFTHIARGQPFTLRGELAAYNTHAKLATVEARPALFTEVVGQTAYYIVNGRFAEQKVAVLQGFDYANVGVVEGYEIQDKSLVRTEAAAEMITLNDLYGDLEDIPSNELIYDMVDPGDGDIELPVTWMDAKQLHRLKTVQADTTVLKAFKEFAEYEQTVIVNDYMNEFKRGVQIPEHVVVLMQDRVIDGNHKVVAAAQVGTALPTVNLGDLP